MTAIWMGLDTVRRALGEKRMSWSATSISPGDMQTWLGLSPFAKERKLVA